MPSRNKDVFLTDLRFISLITNRVFLTVKLVYDNIKCAV